MQLLGEPTEISHHKPRTIDLARQAFRLVISKRRRQELVEIDKNKEEILKQMASVITQTMKICADNFDFLARSTRMPYYERLVNERRLRNFLIDDATYKRQISTSFGSDSYERRTTVFATSWGTSHENATDRQGFFAGSVKIYPRQGLWLPKVAGLSFLEYYVRRDPQLSTKKKIVFCPCDKEGKYVDFPLVAEKAVKAELINNEARLLDKKNQQISQYVEMPGKVKVEGLPPLGIFVERKLH